MRKTIENSKFDTELIASDWRYSASIVGLIRYFDKHCIDYEKTQDSIKYNYSDITKSKYLELVEDYFYDYIHHIKIRDLLDTQDELDEDNTKAVNGLLKNGATIMKKHFEGITYPEYSKEYILKIVNDNKEELTENIYINGKNLYAKFCNTGCFFAAKKDSCRLVGYSLDAGRKSKSAGYMFDKNTFVYEDCLEFDFIPFAFTATPESIFIHNNFNIEKLKNTNKQLNIEVEKQLKEKKSNTAHRTAIFQSMIKSSNYIYFDVEVIKVEIEKGIYQTMLIRKDAIELFKSIDKYENISDKFVKIDNDDFNPEVILTEHILNFIHLDNYIELMLKQENNNSYYIGEFIKINILLYKGDKNMEENTANAKKSANNIAKQLKKNNQGNKIDSFRNRLLSQLIVKDYDGFNETLLKLSSYTKQPLNFAYDLFDDFENNKNVAYSFVNSLRRENYSKTTETNEN